MCDIASQEPAVTRSGPACSNIQNLNMPSSAAAPEVAFLRFGLVKCPETGYNIEYTLFREGRSQWN